MANQRSDPIRRQYFGPVEFADKVSDWLFYIGAALSFVVLFVEKQDHPSLYSALFGAYVILVVALFVVGQMSRLYLVPRAEEHRRLDFFTNACGVSLTDERTAGYYNNDFSEPIKKMAAQVLENALFSKEIALRMARFERLRLGIYLLLWLVALLNRTTDLGLILAAAQAIFSEQLLSRWLRIEWMRMRFEEVYNDVYKLFASKPAMGVFRAMALTYLADYETTKANGGITLSSSVFERLNPELSEKWVAVRRSLDI